MVTIVGGFADRIGWFYHDGERGELCLIFRDFPERERREKKILNNSIAAVRIKFERVSETAAQLWRLTDSFRNFTSVLNHAARIMRPDEALQQIPNGEANLELAKGKLINNHGKHDTLTPYNGSVPLFRIPPELHQHVKLFLALTFEPQ